MKRRTFDDDAPLGDAKPAAPALTLRPCRFCGDATLWETLSMYGALCHPCFRQYIDEAVPTIVGRGEVLTREDKREILQSLRITMSQMSAPPSREWAYGLQKREQGGEELSVAQREGWRRALRVPSRTAAGDAA